MAYCYSAADAQPCQEDQKAAADLYYKAGGPLIPTRTVGYRQAELEAVLVLRKWAEAAWAPSKAHSGRSREESAGNRAQRGYVCFEGTRFDGLPMGCVCVCAGVVQGTPYD